MRHAGFRQLRLLLIRDTDADQLFLRLGKNEGAEH